MAFYIKIAVAVALLAALLPIMISYLLKGWVAKLTSPSYSFQDIPNLTGKVAIVTGSNTGIGKVTVRELARKNATVIATARDRERGERAMIEIAKELGPSAKIELVILDLASFSSVSDGAKQIKAILLREKLNLDILILNAGIMMPPFEKTEDGFELQFGTNHLGHFLLSKLLLQTIKASKTRVVTVSSCAHEASYSSGIAFNQVNSDKNYVPQLAYGQSKLANVLFANELAVVLNGTGATSNSLHPGMIKTELSRHLEKQIEGNAALILLKPLFLLIELAMMDLNMGALTQLYVATSPKVENVTGRYFEPIGVLKEPSSQARNLELQRKLWDFSDTLTQHFQEGK